MYKPLIIHDVYLPFLSWCIFLVKTTDLVYNFKATSRSLPLMGTEIADN